MIRIGFHRSFDRGRRMAVAALAIAVGISFAGCGQSSQKAKASSPSSTSPTQGVRQSVQSGDVITGTLEYVEGSVSLNGLPAKIGATVKTGDTIKTGSDGVCDLTFLKRNIVEVQSDSLAVINFGDIGRGIQLESGSLAAVLKNLTTTSTGMRFQVDTPTSTAGIRGTAFFVKVINASTTYFCLCNGRISLQDNTGGNQTTLEAAHHKAVEFVRKDGKVSVEKQPLLYHNDAQMQKLASRIGYTIDWSTPDLVN